MRTVYTIPFLLFLSGCIGVVPPVVAVASYAIDGASLLVSGKSVSDHAISEIADEDCAMWRIVKLKKPCRPYQNSENIARVTVSDGEAVTQLADRSDVGLVTARTDSADKVLRSRRLAGARRTRPVVATVPVATTATWITPPRAAVRRHSAVRTPVPVQTRTGSARIGGDGGSGVGYVVFGSFADRENAVCLARAHAQLHPAIVAVTVRRTVIYRVISGGRSLPQADWLRRRFVAAGIRDAWVARLCPGNGEGGACLFSPPRPLRLAGAGRDATRCAPLQAVLRPVVEVLDRWTAGRSSGAPLPAKRRANNDESG